MARIEDKYSATAWIHRHQDLIERYMRGHAAVTAPAAVEENG